MAALNAAVSGVSTARAALLDAAGTVQDGAQALDETDAICAQGHGVAARTSQRKGAAAVSGAGDAVRGLPSLIANYRASLSALDHARTAVSGAALTALGNVVRDGQAEATALARFEAVVKPAWTQYVALDGQERLWIKRAVTPWYRTDKEGANAYAVLVGPYRRLLTVARTQVSGAATALRAPTSAQSATVAVADRAMSGFRSGG